MRPRWVRYAAITILVALVASVAFLLAGAGGGGGGTRSTTTTTFEATPTTVRAAGDKGLAQAAVLTSADLPKGWVGTPHSADNGDLGKELATCTGADPALFGATADAASADSPDFDDPDTGTEVRSSVTVAATEATSKQEMSVIADPKTTTCIGTALKNVLTQSIAQSGDAVDVGPITAKQQPFAAVGTDTISYRATVNVTAEQQTVHLFLDVVAFRGARAGALLSCFAAETPCDTALEQHAAEQVAGLLPR